VRERPRHTGAYGSLAEDYLNDPIKVAVTSAAI